MMKSIQHIILMLFFFLPLSIFSQEKRIETIIESIVGTLEDEADIAQIIEDLEDLAEQPININATNEAELERLYLLNPVQIHQLLKYRNESGIIYSIYELNTLDGFTPELLQRLQPFIYFGESKTETKSLSQSIKKGRQELLLRSLGTVQNPKGYLPREDGTVPYEGKRFRYYSRYKFKAQDQLSFGFTAEKDPGEAFLNGSNKYGFDFYSAHADWTPGKTIRQITFGDFVIRSGQGLALWQGYANGKSPDVLAVFKTGQGIKSYTSVDENAFFRGIASAFQKGNHSLQLFLSHKKTDANIESDESGKEWFTSLQSSGYHRTPSEIEDERSVKESNAGAVYKLQFQNLKIGATYVYQHFNIPFIRSDQLYNKFLFSGTDNYTASIDYFFVSGPFQLFGEAAISKSGGKAFLQGAIARLNQRLTVSALFRHFDKNYQALWANTFAEGSNTNNESGLYFGLRFLPAKHITFSAYSDLYRSPWYSYSTAGPSNGWDALAQIDVKISEATSFYIRYKNEEKEQKINTNKLYVNQMERTQKIRIHFDYQLTKGIHLKTRLEHVFYSSDQQENGILVFQDLSYNKTDAPLSLSTRLAWFKTDSYNSRIYTYENDLLYTFSIPAFFYEGIRSYFNIRYRFSPKIESWLKFGTTFYTNRETISSGYNEIEGSNKSELKIQLRLKF